LTSDQYKLITTAAELDESVAALSRCRVIGADTETTGLDPFTSRVRLLQLATPDQVFIIDLFKVRALDHAGLRTLLTGDEPVKVLHNAKFDVKMLLHHFKLETGGVFDTLLASKLVAAGGDVGHGLAAVSDRHLGVEVDKSAQMSDWSGEISEEQHRYAAKDAALMLPLHEKLSGDLERLGLNEVARIEFECVLPLSALELAGMSIDADCWKKQLEDVRRAHALTATALKSQLAAGVAQLSLFGEPDINLDSPAQVTEALAGMGIKLEGTRNWQLQPFAVRYPVIHLLLEYRALQKSLSSYGESMLSHVNPVTRRLHPDFHQIGATGGRMSCSDPNLQQVPNSPEYRSCFRAEPGRKLVIADYSQIELRILADWSQDVALVKALVSGEDLHCVTASQMLGIKLEEVSKDQRAAAKQLNYGIMYGLGAQGLANRIDCSIEQAEELLHKYFATYSGVAAWLREAANKAIGDHESRTRSGRLIYFNFDANDRAQVAAMQRLGKNSPIQGTSADMIKRALRLIYEGLRGIDAAIVNCIHDEIVVESAETEAETCAAIVEREMIKAAREFIRSVPVSVDTAIASAWLK